MQHDLHFDLHTYLLYVEIEDQLLRLYVSRQFELDALQFKESIVLRLESLDRHNHVVDRAQVEEDAEPEQVSQQKDVALIVTEVFPLHLAALAVERLH